MAHGWSALMIASLNGHDACVEALIRAGAQVNGKSGGGRTALQWACSRARLTTVQLLLQHGAAANERDNTGDSALMKALWSRQGEGCALALLAAGSNCSEADDTGITPLHRASVWAMHCVVLQLLQHGAVAPDVKNKRGETPAEYCRREWEVNAREYAMIPEQHRKAVVESLGRATRWRSRRLLLLLQARYRLGQDISAGREEGMSTRLQVLWVVQRPDYGMEYIFRLIVTYL
ncbi:unnamed protein product [Chrysoparadoxa australica]